MRACQPTGGGVVDLDDVAVHFKRYGEGKPAILLLPTWSLLTSRHWTMQFAYPLRLCTVVSFDGRGNGRSSRPVSAAADTDFEFAEDALALMDVTAVEKAVFVIASTGALWARRLFAEHPERVLGAVFIAPSVGQSPRPAEREVQGCDDVFEDPVGWHRYNRHHWLTDYPDVVTLFIGRIFTEPHSTKQVEDAVGWALETDGEALLATDLGLEGCDEAIALHGTDDALHDVREGAALADCTQGSRIALAGCGHFPDAGDPVRVNLSITRFADGVAR